MLRITNKRLYRCVSLLPFFTRDLFRTYSIARGAAKRNAGALKQKIARSLLPFRNSRSRDPRVIDAPY